jgi:hypothetical protein
VYLSDKHLDSETSAVLSLLLLVIPWAAGDVRFRGSTENGMSRRELDADGNLLSAFALMIVGALGIGLPVALLIIWICA